ncbi:MAG: alpha/beta hydrolase [Candidatus Limnocylindrales bacterium]
MTSPDPAATPESMVVRVGTGERIHYLDWGAPASAAGNDAPVLALVHGIALTAWSWAPVARRLCDTFRVLAIDLRGHGLSEGARSDLTPASLAWDALTVLAANGAGVEAGGPPAVAAGHGAGAMVVAEMARLQPASVAAVMLVDGGFEDVSTATRLSPSELVAALAEPPEVLASMDAFLDDRRDFDPVSWDADQERAARSQVDQKHAGHVALVARPATIRGIVDGMYGYDPVETLTAAPVPLGVLVAGAGTADDEAAHDRAVALDEVIAARAAAGLPPTHVVRFPGTGHNLMRYRPDEVARELLALAASAGVRMAPWTSS